MTWRSSTDLLLSETRAVVLDSNGEGWIRNVGPIQSYERWQVHVVTTHIVGETEVPTLEVLQYGSRIDSTYDARRNTSDTQYMLMPGQSLSFHYQGGTPGLTAVIEINGRQLIRGKVAY